MPQLHQECVVHEGYPGRAVDPRVAPSAPARPRAAC